MHFSKIWKHSLLEEVSKIKFCRITSSTKLLQFAFDSTVSTIVMICSDLSEF